MNAKHTQGRLQPTASADLWNVSYDATGTTCYQALRDQAGNVVALVVAHDPDLFSDPDTRPNAARLAACWNACEGISTDTLELVPRFTEAGIKTVQSVEAQRDELVAALRQTVDMIDNLNSAYGSEEVDAVSRVGRAAIAKATGGAP